MTNSPRLVGILFAAGLAAVVFSACTGDDPEADAPDAAEVTLAIELQGWSGWTEEQPASETISVTASEGESFSVEVISGQAMFTVVEIDDDVVTLESDESFSHVDENSGFSPLDTETEFEIPRPGELDLATPTMDAGTNVRFQIS